MMPPELPHSRTRIQRPPAASMAIQHAEPSSRPLGCQQLGDGDSSRLLYTTTCRDVTCSAISRLASIFVRRSSQVFCRRNQSCGVVQKYLASRNVVSALTPRWLHVANEVAELTKVTIIIDVIGLVAYMSLPVPLKVPQRCSCQPSYRSARSNRYVTRSN